MLIRILSDNPGKTFTRNMDSKFVQTIKELLRVGRDPSVKQILMETLDTFQREKTEDEGCAMLNEMWKKEHQKMVKIHVYLPLPDLRTFANTISGPSRTSNVKRPRIQRQQPKLLLPKPPHQTPPPAPRTLLPHRRSPHLSPTPLPNRPKHPTLRIPPKRTRSRICR